ncbi:hypothetical protein PV326_010896 [Microctonus aethiopoides]|nr:hypothetical protein PV326_010896 [Microctonus aethiopoides]
MKIHLILSLLFATTLSEKKIKLEDIERDNLHVESKSISGQKQQRQQSMYAVHSDDERDDYHQSNDNHYQHGGGLGAFTTAPPPSSPSHNNYNDDVYQQQDLSQDVDYHQEPQQIEVMPKSQPTYHHHQHHQQQQLYYEPEVSVGNQYQSIQQKSVTDKYLPKNTIYIPMSQLLALYPYLASNQGSSMKNEAYLHQLASQAAQQIPIPVYRPEHNINSASVYTSPKLSYQIQPQFITYATKYPLHTQAILPSKKGVGRLYSQSSQGYTQPKELLYTQAVIAQPQTQYLQQLIYPSSLYTQMNNNAQPMYVPQQQAHSEEYTQYNQPERYHYVVDTSKNSHQNYEKSPHAINVDFTPPQSPPHRFKSDQYSISGNNDKLHYIQQHYITHSSQQPKSLLDSYIPSHIIAAKDTERASAIALTCVALATCDDSQSTADTTILKPLVKEPVDNNDDDDVSQNLSNHRINNDEEDNNNSEASPVLPPIILLDFADDSENNSTSDEKSKRTINNELGYGYLKNNLLNGKFNYYFPGGKTGTTVSIEESISPFEPKTIIEPFKSSTERPSVISSTYQPDLIEQVNQPIAQPWMATFPSSQQIFGQRTKLRKAPPNTFSYQYLSTTSQPDYNNHNMGFTTPKPFNNRYNTYTSTPGYNSKYNVVGLAPPGADYSIENPTTQRATLSDDPTVFNLPRFTIENGIKYENKIIWKYPDGRIAGNQPTSFINSYAEYSNAQSNKGINKNPTFQPALTNQNPPFINSGLNKFRNNNPAYHTASSAHQNSRHPMEPITNVHSQRPAQFPNDQESDFQPRPNGNSQAHTFDFSYQDNYGLRQRGNAAKNPVRNDQTPLRGSLKLSVDTDNPEYTYTPPARPFSITTPSSNIGAESGPATPETIAKYSTQVQKYLSKVFSNSKHDQQPQQLRQQQQQQQQQQHSSANTAELIKNDYENIFNYNPSISQYIRDPSSILKVKPTFIQAGDSLVPVIILRVDGARPIESQPSSNINLKSLLQQYISKYAGNQVSTQNFEYNDRKVSAPIDNYNLLNDLSQFTQALRRYSGNANVDPIKSSTRLTLAEHPLNYDDTRYVPKTSYDVSDSRRDVNDNLRSKNDVKGKKIQKIKNVEIINGPHIQNYHESRQS